MIKTIITFLFLNLIFFTGQVHGTVTKIVIKKQIVKSDGNLKLYLTFYGGAKQYITNIKKDKLKVKIGKKVINSKMVKTVPFEISGESIGAFLLIDASKSMSKVWKGIQRALKQFVTKLRNGKDFSSLAEFGHKMVIISDFTSQHDITIRSIDKLKTKYNTTALYEAIFKAIRNVAINSAIPEKKLLIVLSDGETNHNTHTLEECIDEASKNQIDVHAITYYTKTRSSAYMKKAEKWSKIAEKTNSIDFATNKVQELTMGMQKIRDSLAGEVILIVPSKLIPNIKKPLDFKISYEQGKAVGSFTPVFKNKPVKTVENKDKKTTPNKNASGKKTKSKKNKTIWMILLFGGLTLFVIILVYFLMQKKKKQKELQEHLHQKEIERIENEKKKLSAKLEESEKKKNIIEHSDQNKSNIKQINKNEDENSDKLFTEKRIQSSKKKNKTRLETSSSVLVTEIFIDKGMESTKLTIPSNKATIGYDDTNDIVIKVESVSTHHAKFTTYDNGIGIIDLNSSNGTYVNGKKVGDTPVPLHVGDKIQFGMVVGHCK